MLCVLFVLGVLCMLGVLRVLYGYEICCEAVLCKFVRYSENSVLHTVLCISVRCPQWYLESSTGGTQTRAVFVRIF